MTGGVHRSLVPLSEAAMRARATVIVLPVPMRRPSLPRAARRASRPAEALAYLLAHLRLVTRLWRSRSADLLLVREFLTVPLLLVWPLIWPIRARVVALVTFNVQEAHRRPLERAALRLLVRGGCRLACLESSAGFAELGLPAGDGRPLVLPVPVDATIVVEPARDPVAEPVIGVVGTARAEKGFEELIATLERLRGEGQLRASVLLGCPDPEVRERWSARGLAVADTTSRVDYLATLDRCDVVVLNFVRDRYFYRTSGVAADALARGAVVVSPDYPVLRHQLTSPVRVGTFYADITGLPDAIDEALALRSSLMEARAAHMRPRSTAAVAKLFDAFVSSEQGSASEHDASATR
ncbi:MAG: hypothetical protein O3C25_01970 [Chloroflexi bacterium]|nr:hypothetical protein [Chloroflexota bacterium]